LDELTSVQLSEWEAYDRLDPIGEWRADFRTASLISQVVNIARTIWGKRSVEMTAPLDYMPEWDRSEEEPKRQSVEEMKQILLGIAGTQNVRKKRRLDKPKKL